MRTDFGGTYQPTLNYKLVVYGQEDMILEYSSRPYRHEAELEKQFQFITDADFDPSPGRSKRTRYIDVATYMKGLLLAHGSYIQRVELHVYSPLPPSKRTLILEINRMMAHAAGMPNRLALIIQDLVRDFETGAGNFEPVSFTEDIPAKSPSRYVFRNQPKKETKTMEKHPSIPEVTSWIENNVTVDANSWTHPRDAYGIYKDAVGTDAVAKKVFTRSLNLWAVENKAERARRRGYDGWRISIKGAPTNPGGGKRRTNPILSEEDKAAAAYSKRLEQQIKGNIPPIKKLDEGIDLNKRGEQIENEIADDIDKGDAAHWQIRMREEELTEAEIKSITTRTNYLDLDVEDTIQDVIAARDLPSTSPADVTASEPDRTEPMPIPELQDDAKAANVCGMLVLKEGMTESQRNAAALSLYNAAKDLFDELKPVKLIKARKRAAKQHEFDVLHKSVRENYCKFILWCREKTMTKAEMVRYARFSRDDKESPLSGSNGPNYWINEENYLTYVKHTVPYKKWLKKDTHPGVIRETNEKLKKETDTWLERELRRSLKTARAVQERGIRYFDVADVVQDVYLKRLCPLWIFVLPEGNDWLREYVNENNDGRLTEYVDMAAWTEIFTEIDTKGLKQRLVEMWQTGEYKPFSYVQWVEE